MTDFARFNGGPFDGKLAGITVWPPPDSMGVELNDGIYRLTNYSRLTDEAANHPNIARGCEYEWSSNG